MARKNRLMVLPAALLGMLVAVGSARAGGYPVCPARSFTIQANAPGSPIPAATKLVVGDGQVSFGDACPATFARVRGTRKGTRVSARWTSCPGVGRMRIKGMIDPTTCGTFTGKVVVSDAPWKGIVVATAAKGDAVDALRIGTYNVQFLSGIFGRGGSPCHIGNGDNDNHDRPKVIAERVKASGYDVIAFNEMFDDAAQDEMVKAMKDVYPFFVQKLDPDPSNQQDSGLQIFSRWAFADFDVPRTHIDDDCWASDCSKVAVTNYDDCDDNDCLAAKGAAMVRVQNPDTGRIYNVVFTHTQAHYDGDDLSEAQEHVDTREKQLIQLRNLIWNNLSQDEQDNEELIVMGDMNVDGDYLNGDLGWDHVDQQNLFEWNHRFNDSSWAGGYFFDVVRDVWDLQNLPLATNDKDRGTTNDYEWYSDPDPAARLDYILRHPEPGHGEDVLCAQHVYKGYNLRANAPFTESAIGEPGTEGGSCDLSDHVALTMDLNLNAPQCSPQRALVVSVPGGKAQVEPGEIQHAGGMQWFRFDEPGTYGFAVDSDGDLKEDDDLHLQVYVSTDLSNPLHGYKDKTVTKPVYDVDGTPHSQILKEFVIPKAPFYVKVFDPDRTFTGPYGLTAWRADCSSKDEACVLFVGRGEDHTFPAGKPLNATDTAWFEMDSESTDGDAQTLKFGAYDYATNLLSMQLRRSDGVTLLGDAVPTFDGSTWDAAVQQTTPNADTFYMLVTRHDQMLGALTYTARWTTNLSMLVGKQAGPGSTDVKLNVVTPTDDIGSDEIYLTVYADGKVVQPEKFLAWLSNNEFADIDWLQVPIKFTKEVKFVFREEDDNVDELLEVVIPALDENVNCQVFQKQEAVETQGTGLGTIEYWLYYNVCHGLTQP